MSLRLGVAGLQFGRSHCEQIVANPRCRLVAVADPLATRREPWTAAGAVGVADYRELLEHDLDAVVLALPHALHAAAVEATVERGWPILLEKPLATTAADCERIIAAVRRTGVPLLVGQLHRFGAGTRQCREELACGRYGRLVAVQGHWCGLKPDQYFAEGPWKKSLAAGGGPLFMNVIHDVDRLRFIAGDVVRVCGATANRVRGFEVEDTAAAVLEFANGALGTLLISDTATAPPQPQDVFYGTRGGLALPSMNARVLARRPLPEQPGQFGESELPYTPADPLADQLNHFLDLVEGAARPICDAVDGAASVDVILAIRTSHETGRAVELPRREPLP